MSVAPVDASADGETGQGGRSVTESFVRGEYGPELILLMSHALDTAWDQVGKNNADAELARLVMASAIIDNVDLGVRGEDELVTAAIAALSAATRLSRGGSDSN
jgi:hypothetical protein